MTGEAGGDVRRGARWILPLLWAALTVALVSLGRSLPWHSAFARLRELNGAWVFGAAAAFLVILPLWAAEWMLLAARSARVTFARMFGVVAAAAAVLNSIPMFAGEATAVVLLISRCGLSRGQALSVLALDQLLVAFAKLSIIGAAAMLAPMPAWLRAGVLSLTLGFAALALLLVPLAHRWKAIHDRVASRPTRARALLAKAASWGRHLDALRDRPRMTRLVLLALCKKGAEVLGIIALQASFGLAPSLESAVLLSAALSVTTMVPLAPANIGVYEATVYAVYRFTGVAPDLALGMGIAQHVIAVLPPLVTGYLSVIVLQWRRPSAAGRPDMSRDAA